MKPASWILVNNKDEETYYYMFNTLKDIVGASGTLKWFLSSVTLDFEAALLQSFSQIFENTKIIGCLFHFKQALFREAQSQGLTKSEMKEGTQILIQRLGALSWKGNTSIAKEEIKNLKKQYQNTQYNNLILYYENNWFPKLECGLIDYSHIDDEFRANSVLEKYNCHIKDSLPRCPNWPKFIDFLVSEEAKYVQEAFLNEQKGLASIKSTNFGQTYLPKSLKVKKSTKKTGKANDSNETNAAIISLKRKVAKKTSSQIATEEIIPPLKRIKLTSHSNQPTTLNKKPKNGKILISLSLPKKIFVKV